MSSGTGLGAGDLPRGEGYGEVEVNPSTLIVIPMEEELCCKKYT
jgi:hypothetical protein